MDSERISLALNSFAAYQKLSAKLPNTMNLSILLISLWLRRFRCVYVTLLPGSAFRATAISWVDRSMISSPFRGSRDQLLSNVIPSSPRTMPYNSLWNVQAASSLFGSSGTSTVKAAPPGIGPPLPRSNSFVS